MTKPFLEAALAAPTNHRAMHWLVHLGAVGLFGVSLLDACPFPLPIPGTTDLLLLILIARKGNPWLLVALAAGGAVAGAFTTWSAGKKGGEEALRRYVPERYYDRITGWVKRYGATAVALAAINPPPIPLMPFLAAAGALGVTRARFLTVFTLARTARYSRGGVAGRGVWTPDGPLVESLPRPLLRRDRLGHPRAVPCGFRLGLLEVAHKRRAAHQQQHAHS